MSDPAFDLCLRGNIDLKLLPPIVTDMTQGYLSGVVETDIDVKGRMSMLSSVGFHNLYAKGKMQGRRLYYLSDDTAKMVDIPRLGLAFTSSYRDRDSLGRLSTPMLGAGLKVDTATMLFGGTEISVAALTLGAGVENSGAAASPTAVLPFGGGIKIGRFNVESVTDSAGATFQRHCRTCEASALQWRRPASRASGRAVAWQCGRRVEDFAFCFVRRLA